MIVMVSWVRLSCVVIVVLVSIMVILKGNKK